MQDFSPQAQQRLNAFLDETYRGFKEHVAAGRHLSADQVEAVAKGRVWSGEEAKAKGLVDELGGLGTALRLAKDAAKIAPDKEVKLTVFPRDRGTLERIYDRFANPDRDNDAGRPSALERTLVTLDAVITRVDALAGEAAVLRMPEIGEPQ
jgi:protease-4